MARCRSWPQVVRVRSRHRRGLCLRAGQRCRRCAPGCGRSRRGIPGMEPAHRARACATDQALARTDPAAPGRPGAHHLHRTRQAPQGSARRGAVRRLLCRMVRRGSNPHLRRHRRGSGAGPQAAGPQGAGRRGRRDHAVEFPAGDDRPQDSSRASRRMHGRGQARGRHTADRAGAGLAGAASRHPVRRAQHGHGLAGAHAGRGRCLAGRQPRAQDHLHRLHAGGQASGA
ncbi:hypothetical protein D3C72_1326510 [compost metagenome]